ncbi:diguanylate cyclase [Hahella sp. CR1]|uniref:diguanylate cyclase domain-containing protein n=1 Tax=Hahella sp. CR1 TaxID=2992807 RepID=UPI0024422B1F|nr:diguanylate cyclase [Hahella sp. CR1]MDG9669619.1 diguanylate cyclase [Hahella sp. CR1]
MLDDSLWKLPLPHLFAETDSNGEWTRSNSSWAEYTGYTSVKSLGRQWIDAVHPDDVSAALELWRSGIESQGPFQLFIRLKRSSDSVYRRHICRVLPVIEGETCVSCWLASFTDIHDFRGQAGSPLAEALDEKDLLEVSNDYLMEVLQEYYTTEKRLEKATAKLNQIVQAQALLSQAELDIEAFSCLVTEQVLSITPATGAAIELISGKDLTYQATSGSAKAYRGLSLSIDNSLSGLCVAKRKVLASENTAEDPRVDYETCKRTGVCSMVVAPLFDEGNVVGVLKITSDKTRAFHEDDAKTLEMMAGLAGAAIGRQFRLRHKEEMLEQKTQALHLLEKEVAQRKIVERKLKESEARNRTILESSHEAFIAIDANGIITDWNKQATETLGWTSSQAIGQRLSELIIPEPYRELHEKGMRKFLDTGDGHVIGNRLELSALNSQGVEIPVEITITAISTNEGWQFCAFLHDISDRKKNEEKLLYMAQYDNLTELPNRSLFYDRLNHARELSRRNNSNFSLMYLDIDHFKSINDTYGHGVGDELLKAFSQRVKSTIRESDTLARLGGDEFVIISEDVATLADAEQIAQKIVSSMKADFQLSEMEIKVGTSIGVIHSPSSDASLDAIVRMADEALYLAKAAGRNTYAVYQNDNSSTLLTGRQ